MHKDETKVGGFRYEVRFEDNFAAANEGSGMYRYAAIWRTGEQLVAMRGKLG